MPTLNEVPQVANLLATILTTAPVTHGAVAVVPLLAPSLDDPDWLTLDESGERSRVTEVSEAGTVAFLKVANDADQPLPRLRKAKEADEGGRGLQLVAMLSARWGARPTAEGKVVWCELPRSRP